MQIEATPCSGNKDQPFNANGTGCVCFKINYQFEHNIIKPFFRRLKSWNIFIASKRRQRMLAAELAGGVMEESVLSSFSERGRCQVMCQAAYVWVENLVGKL